MEECDLAAHGTAPLSQGCPWAASELPLPRLDRTPSSPPAQRPRTRASVIGRRPTPGLRRRCALRSALSASPHNAIPDPVTQEEWRWPRARRLRADPDAAREVVRTPSTTPSPASNGKSRGCFASCAGNVRDLQGQVVRARTDGEKRWRRPSESSRRMRPRSANASRRRSRRDRPERGKARRPNGAGHRAEGESARQAPRRPDRKAP